MTIETHAELPERDEGWPLVSLIIPNWNGMRYIEQCVGSVLETEYPSFEVILVDEASTDGSLDVVKRRFSDDGRLKILSNAERLGLVGTYQRGLQFARGEYLAFMHNDIVVSDKAWLRKMIRLVSGDRTIGAAQPKMLWNGNPRLILSIGWEVDRLGYPIYPSLLQEDKRDDGDQVRDVFIAWDACLVTRRDIFYEVGGFNTSFKFFLEDYDFCWRLHLRGYRVVCAMEAEIRHQSAQMASTIREEAIFHNTKNHLMILVHNFGTRNLVLYLPVVLIMTAALTTTDAIVNYRIGRSRVRGVIWLMRNLRTILSERSRIQKTRRVDEGRIAEIMMDLDPRVYLNVWRERRRVP